MTQDGDGSIAFDEFLHGLDSLGFDVHPADAALLFRSLDIDASGELETPELELVLFGEPLAEAERQKLKGGAARTQKHAARGKGRVIRDGGSQGQQAKKPSPWLLPFYVLVGAVSGGTRSGDVEGQK